MMRFQHKFRALINLLIALSVAFASAHLPTFAAATPAEKPQAPATGLSELVLQLRWDHQFQFAGYYAAQWMGYYEEEGFTVDIRPAFTEDESEILDAALEVQEGRADFGVGAANLMIAQDAGMDLILVASIFQRSAVEYCTLLEDRGNTVFDLSQLHIARRPGDLLDLELQALFASEGITPFATRTTDITRDFTLEDLIRGDFDVVPDFLGQIPYAASKAGIPVKVIRPAEHGIDFYGDTLITSAKLANANPELVERFRRASIKGWTYALEHPMEISELIVERLKLPEAVPETAPEMQALKDFNAYQATKVLELTHYPIVEMGNINPFRWIKMAEAMKSLGMIEEVPDLNAMIFDYDQIKVTQLETTRKNLAIAFAILTGFLTLFFLVYLKRRNGLLVKEISDRQLAEHKLVLSNARYETIFRSSVLGITVTDANGRIRHVNDAWCSMTGYTADKLCEMNINQLIAPESREIDAEQHRDLMAGRITSYSVEKKYLRKSAGGWGDGTIGNGGNGGQTRSDKGGQTPTESSAKAPASNTTTSNATAPKDHFYGRMVLTRIWDSGSDTMLNMSMVTDITREVEDAAALRRAETLIRYQGRMAAMGEMIGSIAHQWRQPLHTLKLVLMNLRDPGNEPDYIEASYQKASALIRRMSETIDDFRYFSSPRTEPRAFTVAESVRLVLGLVDEQLRVSGITLETENLELLPIIGFDNQFSHVLFNLISNAIDALKQNPPGLARAIHIAGQQTENALYIRVADTGPGISAKDADQIFEMYYTTKAAHGGTGLGLPMARSIIESTFGGRLTLISAETAKPAELAGSPQKSTEDSLATTWRTVFEIELPLTRKAGAAS
ncbi:ABC transporter substrate-binding protein [Acidaminobacter hydrogenoformans]|nr:ABC transporter substrate-binding protein [Acidaminobacter hydrogenoformans]